MCLGSLFACNQPEQTILFERLSPEDTHIDFANTITISDSFNVTTFDYIYNGGGVAIGDINNDSLPDVYFTGNMVSSRLYLNKGNFQFEDITQKAGVTTNRWTTGVAMVDINADGWLDMYVCVAGLDKSADKPNLLFINQRNGSFTEEAKQYGLADTGYSTQATFLDYDKDGDLDMYLLANAIEGFNRNISRPKKVSGEGKSTDRLYRNNGNHTFTNVSKEAGITIEGYGLGVAVSDFNQDGWPDIYCANDFLTNDLLWINNKNGTFTNQIRSYLKHQSHNGMGIDVADFNNDGLVDIIEVDMMPEDNLRQKTMFPSANYDNFEYRRELGYEIQYVRNSLQLNNGNGTFSEIGQLAGVYATDWSWTPLFADFDNDGYRDLFISNGYGKDITSLDFAVYSRENTMFGNEETKLKQLATELAKLEDVKRPNYIYRNKGNLTFEDKSQAWGFTEPTLSNGSAYADLDNDGDLDLVVNNMNEVAGIYRNNADKLFKNNFLEITLHGDSANTTGVGTKASVYSKGKIYYYEQSPIRGYKSTVDPRVHFGLGNQAIVDSIVVTWPDGKAQVLINVKANQHIWVSYTDATQPVAKPEVKESALFTKVPHKVAYKHQENEQIDFKYQPLLPHKHSQNGPGISVGDVNGDGLEDFYIGGAVYHPGQLFIQQTNGTFAGKAVDQGHKPQEDMGSLLFDADNDGDQDLYVVSGGSEYPVESPHYQDRLYRNTGKGIFFLDTLALPPMHSSGSCVTAADFDKDGDLDLFVGGRILPGKYPMPARSYILRNTKGKFEDVTRKVCPPLVEPGLVTTALWTDFDNDAAVDLIVTGEWMPIRFFKNTNGALQEWEADRGVAVGKAIPKNQVDEQGTHSPGQLTAPLLAHSFGWWNSLTAGDFDNDGDIDYVAGNLGLNSRYKASVKEPVCVYAKDYDNNGSIDPVFCYYILGKNYPTHPRDALTDQMIGMRKRFPRYTDYGKATLNEVLSEEELKGAYVTRSEYFQSSYIENLGKGKFRLQPLPMQAQFAPVFGIVARDYDQDGNLDILLTGNSYATEVIAGWYDAFIGLYLKGNGKGNFAPVSARKSGFFIDCDAKGMAEIIQSSGKPLLMVACNSDSLQVFSPVSSLTTRRFKAGPLDAYVRVERKNGQKSRLELYYGSTYLSQSSRSVVIPADAVSVTAYTYTGEHRSLDLLVLE
jgi:hypothetical protein